MRSTPTKCSPGRPTIGSSARCGSSWRNAAATDVEIMIAFAFRRRAFAPLLAAIVLLTLTGCGAAPTAHPGSAPVVNTASDDDMALYNRVLGRVRASYVAVSYTHLRAHETGRNLVCR